MFLKNKEYSVIKLFKIVDIDQAEEFCTQKYILDTVLYLNEEFVINFNHYLLNFGHKEWKTFNGFKKGMRKFAQTEVIDLLLTNDKRNVFSFSNFLLNLETNAPENGVIEIIISIEKEMFNLNKLNNFLISNDLFDYGYITELSTNYDFNSETKIKKGLFSQSITTDEYSVIWSQHKYAMIKGFLRKIYSYNFLNYEHCELDIIKKLKHEKIGEFTKINNNLTAWTLNEKEKEIAIKAFKNTKYLLATEDAYKLFKDSSEAVEYYSKTDLGLEWNSETGNYEYSSQQ